MVKRASKMKVRTEGLKNKSSSNITKNSTNKSIRNTKGADFNDDNSTRVAGPYARDPAVDSWGSGDKTSNTHSGDRRDHLLGARAAYQVSIDGIHQGTGWNDGA